MHDWWIALATSTIGKLIPLDEPLVQYRQHAGNTIGAHRENTVSKAKKLLFNPLKEVRRMKQLHRHQAEQARALFRWLPDDHPFRQDAECYAAVRDGSVLDRVMNFRLFRCHKYAVFHVLVP